MIGALIGGAINRAGLRGQEAAQRQRDLEDYGRQAAFSTLLGHLDKNYENMLPEEQEAIISQIEPLIPGMKKGTLSPLVGGVKGFHAILPPPPEWQPPEQPRTSMEALPPPVSAPIYAQVPQQEIGMAAQTPGQIKAERINEQQRAIRQQRTAEIMAAPGLTDELRQAAIAHHVGDINPVPVITSKIGAESRERISENQANQFKGNSRLVIRNGMPLPVRGTGRDEFILDPQQGWIPLVPQEGDEPYEKQPPLGTVTGAKDVYSYDRKAGTVKPLNIGTPPAKVAAPQSQLTTITTPEGPQLVEYSPSRGGGKGQVRVVQPGAVKGTVPALPEGAQRELTGLGLGAQSLSRLQQLLPQISTGPLWGRLRNVQLKALGGAGATPDEVKVATQINMLMRSAFDVAGANFTEPEMNIFRTIYPQQTDTLETALVKIPESLKYIQDRMQIRKGMMSPMQRSQTQFPDVSGTASTPGRRERRSKSTGEYQHSLDGGATWLPGRLPGRQ